MIAQKKGFVIQKSVKQMSKRYKNKILFELYFTYVEVVQLDVFKQKNPPELSPGGF